MIKVLKHKVKWPGARSLLSRKQDSGGLQRKDTQILSYARLLKLHVGRYPVIVGE